MASGGMIQPARQLLDIASDTNPRWPEFVRRFAASGAQPELAESAVKLLARD
jgi:hypothetical protein